MTTSDSNKADEGNEATFAESVTVKRETAQLQDILLTVDADQPFQDSSVVAPGVHVARLVDGRCKGSCSELLK